MRLLAVSHWSFGRERALTREFRDLLEESGLDLHDFRPDLDLNRTTVACSGNSSTLHTTLLTLAETAFPRIDLTRHMGANPRTGALDECSVVVPSDSPSANDIEQAHAAAETFGAALAATHGVPVYLHGRTGRHGDAELTSLREGGFGQLLERPLRPDFGPSTVHPHLGIALVGVREFWMTLDVRLSTLDLSAVRGIAAAVPQRRAVADPRFLGVEASAYRLPAQEECSVVLEMTLPDLTSVDSLVAWAIEEASVVGVAYKSTDVVGAIRRGDLSDASRARVRENQVAW